MLLPMAGLNRPPRSVGPLLTDADDFILLIIRFVVKIKRNEKKEKRKKKKE
jgi:hypothetical protein